MKYSIVTSFGVILLLMSSGSSQASVQFTVEGATFSNLIGNNENFRWNVQSTPTPLDLGPLNVGEMATFTYGTFSTNDFGIGGSDASDNDDSFDITLDIVPPDPAAQAGGVGFPDAARIRFFGITLAQWVNVDFDNTPVRVDFDNGGSYQVEFLDSNTLFADGSVDLEAKLTLLSEPGGVPEPAAFAVWCSLLGLATSVARRKIRQA